MFRIADYLRDASFVGASNYGGSLDKTSGVRRAYRRFVNSLTESAIYGGSRFDPTSRTRRVVLAAVQVRGVPDIAVEEAIWLAVNVIRS